MNNGKKIPNKRRSKGEGHMSQLIRRKMIQRDHGDKSKFSRKEKHKKFGGPEGPSYIYTIEINN
jgi:hypothetical protein